MSAVSREFSVVAQYLQTSLKPESQLTPGLNPFNVPLNVLLWAAFKLVDMLN